MKNFSFKVEELKAKRQEIIWQTFTILNANGNLQKHICEISPHQKQGEGTQYYISGEHFKLLDLGHTYVHFCNRSIYFQELFLNSLVECLNYHKNVFHPTKPLCQPFITKLPDFISYIFDSYAVFTYNLFEIFKNQGFISIKTPTLVELIEKAQNNSNYLRLKIIRDKSAHIGESKLFYDRWQISAPHSTGNICFNDEEDVKIFAPGLIDYENNPELQAHMAKQTKQIRPDKVINDEKMMPSKHSDLLDIFYETASFSLDFILETSKEIIEIINLKKSELGDRQAI